MRRRKTTMIERKRDDDDPSSKQKPSSQRGSRALRENHSGPVLLGKRERERERKIQDSSLIRCGFP